jgi:hypothetical protein
MRSQLQRGLRRWSAAVRLLRFWFRIPPGVWMSVCYKCCVLPGRGLCHELITRPEESYRRWCVVVCDLETSWMRPTGGCCVKNKQTWPHDLLPHQVEIFTFTAFRTHIYFFKISILISVNFTLMWSIVQYSVELSRANVYHLPSITNCILPTPCTSIYALPMIHRKNADCFLKQHHRQKRAVFITTQELAKN